MSEQSKQTEMLWLKNTNYRAYDGSETFVCSDEAQFTVLELWQHCYSNLANQSATIAEFIVARALGILKAENVSYWTAYDMTYRGMRIEIKSTAYVHPWNKSRISNRRSFSIEPSNDRYWNNSKELPSALSRQSDVYIFCLNSNKDIGAADPLDLDAWTFFVVPTYKINEYTERNGNKSQRTISLNAVKRLSWHQTSYKGLRADVDSAIEEIISLCAYRRLMDGGKCMVPKEITLETFIEDTEHFVRNAAVGDHIKIRTGRGLNAILIDETEWTMLQQALSICTEHPEWTISSK